MANVRLIRAERMTIRFRDARGTWKLFQLGFLPDGGIWAQCPYLDGGGLVAIATMPAGTSRFNVRLDEISKLTTFSVKYSHHPDGEAHFSQTRKVRTLVRRAAVPLGEANGHVFSATVAGLHGFAADKSGSEDTPFEESKKNRTLTFGSSGDIDSIKIVARGHTVSQVQAMTHDAEIGPAVNLRFKDSLRTAHLVSAVEGKPGDSTVIALAVEPGDFSIRSEGSVFTLLGGFDPPNVAGDPSKDLTFLIMKYPADVDHLAATLETIDLI